MQIFRPDFGRRIDLPGAGPCPRPVDIDQRMTGFAELVSLRVYSFARAAVIHGEAEDDELFIIVMRGAVEVAVDQAGARVGSYDLRHEHGTRVVYMPPHSAYRLTATRDADVAYARVKPIATPLPKVKAFSPVNGRFDIVGHATGMAAVLAMLSPADALTPDWTGDVQSERLIHVRSNDDGMLDIAGGALTDWDTAALGAGEAATVHPKRGTVECLVISSTLA